MRRLDNILSYKRWDKIKRRPFDIKNYLKYRDIPHPNCKCEDCRAYRRVDLHPNPKNSTEKYWKIRQVCTKNKVYFNTAVDLKMYDQTFDVTFLDGIKTTVHFKEGYFVGWLTPLSIPEYFKLGRLNKEFNTIMWPNWNEELLDDAYFHTKNKNTSNMIMGHGWKQSNILSITELLETLNKPICDEYVEISEDIEYVKDQIEKIKQSLLPY